VWWVDSLRQVQDDTHNPIPVAGGVAVDVISSIAMLQKRHHDERFVV
jgi:hypothetical protein